MKAKLTQHFLTRIPPKLCELHSEGIRKGFNQYSPAGGHQMVNHSIEKFFGKELNLPISAQVQPSSNLVTSSVMYTLCKRGSTVLHLGPVSRSFEQQI